MNNRPDADTVYREYKEKVTWFVRGKVSDSSMVEDLVSDIFLKIYDNLDRYDPEKASLSTWIYTIASRRVMDYYRTRRVFGQIPTESGEEGQMPDVLVDDEGLDAGLLKNEQLNALADALEKLPVRERDLIILHYFDNMTLKVIAQKMGMSYANIKVIHKKALNRLRTWL